MLRGVNRQIIEVQDIQSAYFERAILFVRPDCGEATERQLRENAAHWLQGAGPLPVKSRRKRYRVSRRALWLAVWLALAATSAFALLYVMK